MCDNFFLLFSLSLHIRLFCSGRQKSRDFLPFSCEKEWRKTAFAGTIGGAENRERETMNLNFEANVYELLDELQPFDYRIR